MKTIFWKGDRDRDSDIGDSIYGGDNGYWDSGRGGDGDKQKDGDRDGNG